MKKKYHLKYYKNNKTKVRVRVAKWRKENREKFNDIQRIWREKNKEKVLAYGKKYDSLRNQDLNFKIRKANYAKKYWSIPENKERRRQSHFKLYKKNPKLFAARRHSSEMRRIIRILTNINPPKKTKLEVMYDLTVDAVLANRDLALQKYPHGTPDARESRVEFKIGLDRLHDDQFVWNICNGHDSRVRWAQSYDDIEEFLSGGINRTRLFESYKDFILWQYGLENK